MSIEFASVLVRRDDLAKLLRTVETPQTAQMGSIRHEFEGHPTRGMTPARLRALLERETLGEDEILAVTGLPPMEGIAAV